jgi:hypothetical protein
LGAFSCFFFGRRLLLLDSRRRRRRRLRPRSHPAREQPPLWWLAAGTTWLHTGQGESSISAINVHSSSLSDCAVVFEANDVNLFSLHF